MPHRELLTREFAETVARGRMGCVIDFVVLSEEVYPLGVIGFARTFAVRSEAFRMRWCCAVGAGNGAHIAAAYESGLGTQEASMEGLLGSVCGLPASSP
jgi:hypothetical protein